MIKIITHHFVCVVNPCLSIVQRSTLCLETVFFLSLSLVANVATNLLMLPPRQWEPMCMWNSTAPFVWTFSHGIVNHLWRTNQQVTSSCRHPYCSQEHYQQRFWVCSATWAVLPLLSELTSNIKISSSIFQFQRSGKSIKQCYLTNCTKKSGNLSLVVMVGLTALVTQQSLAVIQWLNWRKESF